jgi:hypothetical protein
MTMMMMMMMMMCSGPEVRRPGGHGAADHGFGGRPQQRRLECTHHPHLRPCYGHLEGWASWGFLIPPAYAADRQSAGVCSTRSSGKLADGDGIPGDPCFQRLGDFDDRA